MEPRMPQMSLVVDELTIPATVDAPDAADFIEMTQVRNAIEAGIVGKRRCGCWCVHTK